MTVIVFSPTDFVACYPEFANATDTRLTDIFNLVQYTMIDNTDNSPVMDPNFRTQLIYMAMGHLLLIYGLAPAQRSDGTLDNTPPGRISSATEGTITTAFQMEVTNANGSAAWWNQTKYGAMYWMATARFRSFRYFPSGVSGIGQAVAYGQPPFYVPGGV
jgi:hypothetical protein